MSENNNMPSDAIVREVLNALAPTFTRFRVEPLAGSYSNHTHLIAYELPDGSNQRIVIRRYNEANGDCVGKARREFRTLQHLQAQSVPAPKPLLLDDEGKFLGTAGIVTEFVPGEMIDIGKSPEAWEEQIDVIASLLARIHQTPYDQSTRETMMNGNVEAAWFAKTDRVPDFMTAHPDGALVWNTVAELLPKAPLEGPVLLHIDYWSGNLLWHEGKISAVVDWEEAAFGDPAIDVAYCRMELYLVGLDEAAQRFLEVYEKEVGKRLANLGLWELAAAARPMYSGDDWFSDPEMRDRFRRFIASAVTRARA